MEKLLDVHIWSFDEHMKQVKRKQNRSQKIFDYIHTNLVKWRKKNKVGVAVNPTHFAMFDRDR